MRKLIVLLVATAALSTAACNTIAGAGRDTSSVGSAVTDAAKYAARAGHPPARPASSAVQGNRSQILRVTPAMRSRRFFP